MNDEILIALGSNLPDRDGRSPLDLCRWAVHFLTAQPALTPVAVSSWYRTAPVPPSGQPDYVNGVARFASKLSPSRILAMILAIEAEVGRGRSVPNAARVLDLDLLAYGDEIVAMPELIVPHPRLHERAFVLYPLCDVAPDWRHPRLGRTATELRDALPPEEIERLAA